MKSSKKILLIAHIVAVTLIFSDNILLFQFLKNNSNRIKEKIASVQLLKSLSSTLIRDLNYRKKEKIRIKNCLENLEGAKNIIAPIEDKRLQQIEMFFDHYRESESILSNTIFLGDLINEFMVNHVDTLFLPFIGETKYCYDIMSTQWCQYETVELFVFPSKVALADYNPELSEYQYFSLKNKSKVTACGSDDVIFNLIIDGKEFSSTSYYLYVYGNEAFVTTRRLILAG